jgi:hypothetical protein
VVFVNFDNAVMPSQNVYKETPERLWGCRVTWRPAAYVGYHESFVMIVSHLENAAPLYPTLYCRIILFDLMFIGNDARVFAVFANSSTEQLRID